MGSPACAEAVQEIIEACEYGAKPYPIFFADVDCSTGRWPPEGQTVPDSLIGNTPGGFNLRLQACLQSPGVPAAVDILQGSDFPPVPAIYCPLPAINTMILPAFYNVTFYAATSNVLQAGAPIQNPGALLVVSEQKTDSQNFLKIIPSNDPRNLTWGSSTSGPIGGADCSYTDSAAPFGAFFDQNTDAYTFSLNSCGQQFWPSLAAVDPPVYPLTAIGTHVDGATGLVVYDNNNSACNNSPGAVAANEILGGNIAINHCSTQSQPNFSYKDCIQVKSRMANMIANQGTSNADLGPFCACTYYSTTSGGPRPVCTYHTCEGGEAQGCFAPPKPSSTCGCTTNQQLGGSLQSIEIVPADNSWEVQQFQYCVGLKQFSIGGIDIQRYGNSTVACDPIVESLCQNSAFIASNPNYTKACSCILEQAKFNAQFAGLDLPVQCFTGLCSDNDSTVYKTTQQALGCSARLCEQIIEINGSAISSEGFQTMLCNGQEYVVATTNPTPGPVPIISVGQPKSVTLGPVFFIALGLLGIMVILLVAWGIRKWVVTKRQQKAQKQQITHALEDLIQSK